MDANKAARVLIGIFFCISGGTKLLVPTEFTLLEQTLAQSHIPFPHANALFVSLVEFACGGGHPAAAGARIPGKPLTVQRQVLAAVKLALAATK